MEDKNQVQFKALKPNNKIRFFFNFNNIYNYIVNNYFSGRFKQYHGEFKLLKKNCLRAKSKNLVINRNLVKQNFLKNQVWQVFFIYFKA